MGRWRGAPTHSITVIVRLMPIQSSLSREIGTRRGQTRQRGGGWFGSGGGSSGGAEERGSGSVTGWAEPTWLGWRWYEEGTQRDPLFGVYGLSEVGERLQLLGLFTSFSFIRMYVASAKR